MPAIKWEESLELGISEIDEQHQRLIGYVNELHTSMIEGKARERIAMLLDDLMEYADVHFTAEEQLMDRHGYADSPLHRLEHGNFINKVRRLIREREREEREVTVTLDLMTFLRDWVTGHIMNTDRRYAPYLKAKGVQ